MSEEDDQLPQPTNGTAAATAMCFNLPEPLLAILPSDPFDQLDVARKITSIALATRLAILEDEIDGLRRTIGDRDDIIAELRAQLDTLESSLGNISGKLDRAQEEKETLSNENASLSDTVNKLSSDVSKLEDFKKALMESLKEETESHQIGASRKGRMQISKVSNLSFGSLLGGADSSNPLPKLPTASETGYSNSNDGDFRDVDASKHVTLRGFDLPSNGGTPRLTPPGSPPRLATGFTPNRLSRPLSPRRHSTSVATTKNAFDNRLGMISSIPAAHNSTPSPYDTEQTGRPPRVDGKEFFRQVRSRLSYEQFSSFLSNVKELNSQKQTRAETLHKAGEIFGPDNKDLYTIFEGLINRNLH